MRTDLLETEAEVKEAVGGVALSVGAAYLADEAGQGLVELRDAQGEETGPGQRSWRWRNEDMER